MKIDEALKLSDVAVSTLGTCVTKSKQHDWYHCGGHTGVYSLYELTGKFPGDTWKPAYIRPQFQIGENVSFLQACLSGQCFRFEDGALIRKCVDITTGKILQWYKMEWTESLNSFYPCDIVIIVADPSQEQPEPAKPAPTVEAELEQLQDSVTDLDYRICLIGDTLRELVEKLGATK